MKRLFPILAVFTAIFLAYALYQALAVAPTDAQQGDVYRIIYYHVPSAWTAFLLFFINFIASIQYLASKKPSTQSCGEVDCACDRSDGRGCVFSAAGAADAAGGHASERGGDDGAVDSDILFLDRKIFSGRSS